MSIVSSIRDYVEFLNTLSDSLGTQFTSSKLITESWFYFFKTLQYSLYYLLSLQWLRDFTLLPVTIPQISKAIFSENLFLENPEKVFFNFLEISSLNKNKFLLGLFNSFFLTLPITVTHLIALRRFIIQGRFAGIVSFLGFILGQTFFILCVTFGIRTILIPWLSLEPFNYLLGLILIFQIVYSMVPENLVELKWDQEKNKKLFQNFFLINFLLAWCEQSSIFQYLSNVTLTGNTSILEGFSGKTTVASFFSHSTYIFGIFIGSVLFSSLWMFFAFLLKKLLERLPGISLNTAITNINWGSFIVILGFTLSSIPFYSLEYLVTGPLGFVSQDSVFQKTIFSENQVKDPLAKTAVKMTEDENFNFNVSLFDRGHYLILPDGNDKYSFEDLNYRGEMDWITRQEKRSDIVESKGSFFSLAKIFSKEIQKRKPESRGLDSQESNMYLQSNTLIPEEEALNFQFSTSGEAEYRFDNFSNFAKLDSSDPKQFEIQKTFKIFNQNSFSPDFLRENSAMENQLEKKIKQKYYSNPIYKNLLALDIDLFLNRQTQSYFLTGQHELDLFEKRQLLNCYYDSLRLYKYLPYSENFEDFFNGTKSFTNKIYNQQFKGTLRSIRRLFSLSSPSTDLISTKTNSLNSVLKYDQPLYESEFKFSPYHEEIPEIDFFYQDKSSGNRNSNPFLRKFVAQFISKPLYAGWDETLRKFVITNKLLPRFYAGYEMNISQDFAREFNSQKQFVGEKNVSKINKTNSQKINFTVWPKPKHDFNFDQPEKPFSVLFKYITSEDSLPSNFKIVEPELGETLNLEQKDQKQKEFNTNLAPKRGGFIWPGNDYFPFEKFIQLKK